MRLSIRTCFDDRLVENTAEFPVVDLFGTMPLSPTGQGLPAFLAPEVTRKRVEEHVRTIHKAGLTFTYVMDATTMGTREHEPTVRKRLLAHFGWLCEIGTDRIRLSMPYLVDLVARSFPDLEIEMGTASRLESPVQAAHLVELGAASLIADPMIARDPERLALIRAETDRDLSIVADAEALPGSPHEMTLYRHSVCCLLSREHLPPGREAEQALLYCLACDLADKLQRPHELLEAGFIRPEDLAYYEKLGFDRFVIGARSTDADQSLRRVSAWASGRFDGNLAELVPLLEPDLPEVAGQAGFAGELEELEPLSNVIFIDNCKLAGFLEEVIEERSSAPYGRRQVAKRWAEHAIRVDRAGVGRWLDAIGRVRTRLAAVPRWEV